MTLSTHKVYQSLSDFGHALASNPRVENVIAHSFSMFRDERCNGFSLSAAIECAKQGGAWIEGAQKLEKIEFDTCAQFESEVKTLELAPVGFMPSVPCAVMNLPCSMIGTRKESKPKKIIKIAVLNSTPANVSEDQTLNRGRAVLGVIERLEILGYSVEIWAISNCFGRNCGARYLIETCIKRSNEAPNFPACAFALCSTVFTRRLFFREAESDAGAGAALTRDHYGIPTDLDGAHQARFDVYFGAYRKNESQWSTPNKARAYVLQSIKDQLGILS